MKKLLSAALLTLAACCQAALAENYSLTLSSPGKPASMEVQVMNGSITVQGYEGKTVEISTSLELMETLKDDHEDHEVEVNVNFGDNDVGKRKRRSTSGLKKVNNSAMQIEIEERNNKVEIGSHTRNKSVNLVIKVPFNTSLELGVYRGGDIRVSDITGSMELSNSRGGIVAENVTGPIVAESHRKDIEVTFKSLDQGAPSSLTSHRGSIDVTLPGSMKADVQVQTYKGEIYSGLDVPFKADNQVNHKKKGSSQEITIGGLMSAKLGGGGQTLTLATYRGDIYVRKP